MGGSYPDDWDSRRKKIYRRDNYRCQNCGVKGGPSGETELHAHHIVPKSKGGSHRKSNLVTMCKACHNAIHGEKEAPTAASTSAGFGGFWGHVTVFIFFGWWTFGAANLLYAAIAHASSHDTGESETWKEYDDADTDDDGYVRLGKSETKGYFQKKVDKRQNKRHDGCPECGEEALTVSWIGLEPGSKVKVTECEACSAMFEEIENSGAYRLQPIEGPQELDPTSSAVKEELLK